MHGEASCVVNACRACTAGGQHTTCRAARPHAMPPGPITPTLVLVYLAQFCSESLSFCVKHQHKCTEKRWATVNGRWHCQGACACSSSKTRAREDAGVRACLKSRHRRAANAGPHAHAAPGQGRPCGRVLSDHGAVRGHCTPILTGSETVQSCHGPRRRATVRV